jgi:hypothetical protein
VREPQECLHKLHQIISYNLNLERFIIRFSDFDLSHVNEALIQHKSKPVHGIIDGRIIEGKAIVDYANYFCIYSKTLLFKDLNFINKVSTNLKISSTISLTAYTIIPKSSNYHYFKQAFLTFTESLLMFVALII